MSGAAPALAAGARDGTAADAVLGVVPRRAYEPASEDEAREAMRACAAEGLRVAFVGGGTDLGVGAPPAALDAVVRTGRLARIVEHAPADQIVRVEAGMTIAALQRALAPHGQRLALDPPLPERATAGGVVAANAFGPLRTRYGGVRDLVIGASFVRADGVLARGGGKVVKNVAGFDLPRLLVGSLGTLALVTSVTFRLHPIPQARATVLFPALDPRRVRALVRAWTEAQVEPAAAAALVGPGGWDLAVRLEGFAPGVAQQSDRLLGAAAAAGAAGARLDEAAEGALWARHDAIRVLGAFRAKLSARPADVEGAGAALAGLLAALPGGAGVWYPTLGLGYACGDAASPAEVAAAATAARAALAPSGGALVVAAASAEVRARFDPWGAPPSALAVMRRLKAQLDPDARLAPGRHAGGI